MLIALALAQSAEAQAGVKIDLAPAIIADMRKTLLDPESARDLRICEPKLPPDGAWVVFYSYRAKNSMGGYAIGGFTTVYSNGRVTGTLPLGEAALSVTSACPTFDATKLAEAMR